MKVWVNMICLIFTLIWNVTLTENHEENSDLMDTILAQASSMSINSVNSQGMLAFIGLYYHSDKLRRC
jgi:hypothetical protein